MSKLPLDGLRAARIPPQEIRENRPMPPSARISAPFVRGPIPLAWILRAGSLQGKALMVGMALWYRAGCTKSDVVTPSHALWRKFDVSRQSAYRAIKALDNAGLIQVERRNGKNPIITILRELGEASR